MKIGFIGLGTMGRPMAMHLLDKGHDLAVYGVRPASTDPLVAAGATSYATPVALAAASEVIVTMITSTADVDEVLLGKDGIVEGARPGTVVVDMSTISPTATRRIAATLATRQIDMLDAPVSGGPTGAQNATLIIMVGGDKAVLERVRPVLDCLGSTIVHVGEHGAGQTTKACNQLALLVATEGVGEALALAKRCGLDPHRVRQALLGGLAASRVLEVFGARMADRSFDPGIETRLYQKDLRIALDTAREAGQSVPAGALVMKHVEALMEQNQGGRDFSVLIELLENLPQNDR